MNKIKSIVNLLLCIGLLCCFTIMIVKYLSIIKSFEIDTIEISGNKYIEDDQIIEIIKKYIKNQDVINIKLKEINSNLERNEFIHTTKTYTRFPSSLFIEIEELTPLALFEKNKNFYFMDKSKNLIRANYQAINHYINTPIITNLSNQTIELGKIRYILTEILNNSNLIYEKLNEVQYLSNEIILVLNNNTKIILQNKSFKKDLNKFLTFNNQVIIKNNIEIENYEYIDVSIPEQIITRQKNI